jgi:hypothetical protein
MTDPTDAEIVALAVSEGVKVRTGAGVVKTVRAALAKWGAQPVPAWYALVPVEPTPEMVDAAQEAYMPFGDMQLAIQLAIAAAPQPVAREPLSEAQREEVIEAVDGYNFPRDVIDAVERAHGIKGDQHGPIYPPFPAKA